MADVVNVSRASFLWGHVGVILTHVFLALVLLWAAFHGQLLGLSLRIWAFILAALLGGLSLLALIPIVSSNKDVIIHAVA